MTYSGESVYFFILMNRQDWANLVRLIVLSAVIGGSAGILTSALTNNYLSEYSLQLAELTQPLRLSEQRPRNFPQSYEEAVSEVKTKTSPGVVEFYVNKTGQAVFDTVGQPVMYGLVLTSDGWMVTYPAPGQSISVAHIVVQDESYLAQQIISDPTTGAVFVKIDAQNLPVVAFGEGFALETGDQLFILPGADALQDARVIQISRGTAWPQKSDVAARRLVLDLDYPPANGAPAANLAGEFIGLLSGRQVLPGEIILPAFTSLLHTQKIERASLGVKYVDLSQAVGLDESTARGHEAGALLWDNFYAPVPYGSAAALGGLKVNDIILSVDGQLINNQRSLSEYLLDYQPGDTVTLSVDRAGEDLDLTVTLQAQ